MVRETMKKAGLASVFAAAAFAIGVTAASVSPAAAADVGGSFATRVQELNQHVSATDRSGYYAYAPYSYAQMAAMTAGPQATTPSIEANGSFSSRIQNAYRNF
jgi:hypothetical protein